MEVVVEQFHELLRTRAHLAQVQCAFEFQQQGIEFLGRRGLVELQRKTVGIGEEREAPPREFVDAQRLHRNALRREFVGGGWTEANNGTYANIKTTVTRAEDHYKVTGAKFYATGSLYADWLDVIGKGEDGSLITTLVSRHQPGVVLSDDWPGFGQRTTASGSVTYQEAVAHEGDVFPASERVVYQGHFYQTALLAVLTGITRAIQRDGIASLRSRGRNYPQGLDPVPALDAQLLQVIGEVSARVFSTEAALRQAARSLDRIAAAHAAGDLALRDQRAIAGEVSVAQAQLAIVDGVLYAATHVFGALGASATSELAALDRHWRNARTLASHNPVAYKARILGDYLVNDKSPVSSIARLGRGGQGN